MNKAKRLLALLLVVAMTMSYAVMGVSAEEPEETLVQNAAVQPLADETNDEPAEEPEEEGEPPVEEEPEEEDHTPFLSFRWLDNYGAGWFVSELDENDEWAIQHNGWTDLQMAVSEYEELWLIFYMNYYDEDAQQWKHEPVEVTADDRYLTLTKVKDIESFFMPGQPSDYMYRVTAKEAGWDKFVKITCSYGDMTPSVGVSIQRNNCSFYTSATMNNSTYLPKFYGDPFAEEYVFYFGVQDPNWTLKPGSAWLAEDTDGYEVFGEYVTLTELNNGMYKITLDPAMYHANPYWVDYFLLIRFTVVNREDSSWEEEWDCGIWCHSTQLPSSTGIEINGIGYQFFQGTDLVLYYDAELDRDVLRPASEVLPEGVSFDLATSTLTLNNANLTRLGAWNRYDNWEYDEETQQDVWVSYGYNFPNGLTIELVGENTIISSTDTAMGLGEELDVTITGDGSLNVIAINSEDNVRTGWWWNGEEEIEHDAHYSFHAISLYNSSNLTIEDSAEVTVEVQGKALNEWYDEESGEFVTEQAFLCAIDGGRSTLTVKDNAKLTTVLPEDAKTNGPIVEVVWTDDEGNERTDYQTPGGYRGINDFLHVTVSDNAEVNTTSLRITDWMEWDEETEQDVLIEEGTFTQNGGTVNITALASINMEESWYWDEETEQDVYEGLVEHAHYDGLGVSNGTITINGGTLNITVEHTGEQTSAWGRALYVENNSQLIVNGGEINIDAGGFNAIELNGWYDDWNEIDYRPGLTVNGGTLNLNNGQQSFYQCDVNVEGGTLNLNDGYLYINSDVNFNGGDVNLTNVETHVNDGATVTIDGAAVTVNDHTPAEDDGWPVAMRINWGTTLVVNSGSLSIYATGYECGLEVSGDYIQTGGTVTIETNSVDVTENRVYAGMFSGGLMDISGGTLNITTDGWFGLEKSCEEGTESAPMLTVSDDAVMNVTAAQVALYLNAPTEITGGSVNAEATGIKVRWITEDGWWGDPVEYGIAIYAAESGLEEYPAYLLISGGSHTFTSVKNNSGDQDVDSSYGIYAYIVPVTITGGRCEIHADAAVYAEVPEESDNCITLDGVAAFSCLDRHELEFVNAAADFGNGVWQNFWLEEDGQIDEMFSGVNVDENALYIIAGFPHESINRAQDVVIAANVCEALGHVMGEWYKYKAADENGDGENRRECADCDYYDYEVIENNPFADIAEGKYYYTPVLWAYYRGITSGRNDTTFGINESCTRAQIVTFLWHAAGDPEPTITENPFTDVIEGKYYYKAVLWAYENGITSGTSATTFGVNKPCTREQAMTFLWIAKGRPEPVGAGNSFPDVASSRYYYKAVMWAVENGITAGKSNGNFGVGDTCTRAQIVTFLYKAYGAS